MDKEQELNRKLAEWAGFTNKIVKRHSADFNGIYYGQDGKFHKTPELYDVELWHDPEMQGLPSEDKWFAKNGLPDFTQSLDACFKWLVPKLHGRYKLEGTGGSHYATVWENSWQFIEIQEKTPTLALCLAIEKLISADY